jgi:hypothetical protein
MGKIFYIIISSIIFFSFIGCDNGNGLFGHSKTKNEAKANGSTVVEYVPNKTNFQLLDGTKMEIDTAWTEISFTYYNGQKIFDSTYGFNFAIPYTREDREKFSFNFGLADTTNRVFTNGREINVCQLHPRTLKDKMEVLLEQKNLDTAYGWMKPIISDTIVFTKVK